MRDTQRLTHDLEPHFFVFFLRPPYGIDPMSPLMNIRRVVCYEAWLGSMDITLLSGFGARGTRDGRRSRGVGGTENDWGTPSINRVQFGQSKTGAQPHLLLGCDECRHKIECVENVATPTTTRDLIPQRQTNLEGVKIRPLISRKYPKCLIRTTAL